MKFFIRQKRYFTAKTSFSFLLKYFAKYKSLCAAFILIIFISFPFYLPGCKDNTVAPKQIINSDTTWIQCSGLPGTPITGFAASGSNLVAGTYSLGLSKAYIYISSDEGSNWILDTSFNVHNHNIGTHLYAGAPVVFIAHNNYLCAGISSYTGNVYTSTDNGRSWTEKDTSFRQNIYCFAQIDSTIFAGTYDGLHQSGVHKSTDNGISWIDASNGLGNNPVKELVSLATYLFAGTNGEGIYRSSDNGASWMEVNTSNVPFLSLVCNENNIFAGAYGNRGNIFVSTDNGNNWSIRDSGLTDNSVNALASGEGYLFAGTNSGLYVSSNNGSSWTYDSVGVPAQASGINTLAVVNSHLYVATSNGVWRYPIVMFGKKLKQNKSN